MKTYVCDSCGMVIDDPYMVRMKEFCLDTRFNEDGIFPYRIAIKRKVHLCDTCFHALHLIGEKEKEDNEQS